MNPPPRLRGRLQALTGAPVNYDPAALDLEDPPPEWTVDDRRQTLPSEPPGEPVDGGSFQTAARLIRGYQFADPSIVRAYYDPESPLQDRNMLLELRALGLVKVHVGVRVAVVWDEAGEDDDGPYRLFGWAYRTLQGHVERGQMDWQVVKRLDTGAVQFRAHAVSRTAPIANPVIWAGFHLLKRYERRIYLASTQRRMRELTERALRDASPGDAIRRASPDLTARREPTDDPAHEALASEVEDDRRA